MKGCDTMEDSPRRLNLDNKQSRFTLAIASGHLLFN